MQWRDCSDKHTKETYQNEKTLQKKCKENDTIYFTGAGEAAENPCSNSGTGCAYM